MVIPPINAGGTVGTKFSGLPTFTALSDNALPVDAILRTYKLPPPVEGIKPALYLTGSGGMFPGVNVKPSAPPSAKLVSPSITVRFPVP